MQAEDYKNWALILKNVYVWANVDHVFFKIFYTVCFVFILELHCIMDLIR